MGGTVVHRVFKEYHARLRVLLILCIQALRGDLLQDPVQLRAIDSQVYRAHQNLHHEASL